MINKKFVKEDFDYMDYIIEHKKNVMKAFNLMLFAHEKALENNWSIFHGVDIDKLKERVIEHDISKFKKVEFLGYRQYFYPSQEDINEACLTIGGYVKDYYYEGFKKATDNHYFVNKHHPEETNSKMGKIDMLELVLDYIAMSIKFNNCYLEYYRNKKEELVKEFGNKIDHGFLENTFINIKSCDKS